MKLETTALALLAAGCLAACTADTTEQDAVRAASALELDSASIAALARAYPRLGTDPLPQPEPEVPPSGEVLETATGEATYYAREFEGRRTASGIPFRHNQMVAAHRSYPFGTILRVTNTSNQRSVNVRVVDRGPHGRSGAGRRAVIDLSRRAAQALGYIAGGRAPVRVEVLEWGSGLGAA